MTDSKTQRIRAARRGNVGAIRRVAPTTVAPTKYPTYRPSGIEWLGDIPEHWQIVPNRAVFEEVIEQNHPNEPMLSVTISNGIIKQKELLEDSSKKDSSRIDKTSYKLVLPGQIAYNKMRAWQGSIGVSKYRGIISPAYVVQKLKNPQNISRYFHYTLRTPAFAKEAERWSYGITSDMWSLRPEHFKMIYVPLPPPAEQAAIVRYLDDADARIRRVIHAREKQLALLTEYKQALIERVVTGQIDVRTGGAYPAYRPSGIDWLGDVPAHWQVRRLGSLGKLSKGNGGTKADNVLTGVPCIRYGELYTKYRFFIETAHSFISPERASDYTSIEYGDVLFAGSGETIEEIGKSAVNLIRGKVVCGGDVLIFKPLERFVPRFLGYVSDCHQSVAQKSSMGRGFTVVHIYGDKLKNLWIAIPPIAEQDAIVRYLDAQTGKIERATAAIRREIDLLKEYRTRLIADVVTGKIDVRAMM